MHHHRQLAARVRQHCLPCGHDVLAGQTVPVRDLARLRVSARLFKEICQCLDFCAPLLVLVLERFPFRSVFELFLRRRVEVQARPEQMERHGTFHGHFFHGPAVRDHEAGLSGDNAAAGHGQKIGDAVGAGDGNQLRIRIDGDPRLDIGGEFAHLRCITGRAHRIDLDQTERSRSGDESRVKMLAVEFHHLVRLHDDRLVHGFDFAVFDQHLAGRKRRAGNGMDRRAAEENGFGAS